MTGTFKDLLKTLKGHREGVMSSLQGFPSLDVERIAHDLEIEAHAEENGKHNQPAANSESPDSNEGNILAEIENRKRKAEEEYRMGIDNYDARIRGALTSTNQLTKINAAGEAALVDFSVQAKDNLENLNHPYEAVQDREAEYKEFRAKNGLERRPKIVDSREKIFRWLIIGIFVLAESAINGGFFAEGSETGLIGGFLEAFVLSILNISIAVLYGIYALPLLWHVQPKKKYFGMFALLLYFVGALAFNLMIGHVRDLFIETNGKIPYNEILQRLQETPFVFVEAKSFFLMALGLLISVVAVIDAKGMDDRYQGYGEVGRLRDEARKDYADLKWRCRIGLTERRDTAINEMSEVIDVMQENQFELQQAILGRSRLHNDFRSYLKHLEGCYTRLIQQYREANEIARSEPPPAYFQKQPFKLILSDPETLVSVDLGGDIIKQLQKRMEYFIKTVNDRFKIDVDKYNELD